MYLKGNCVLKLFAVVRIKLGAVEDSEGKASKEVPRSEVAGNWPNLESSLAPQVPGNWIS